MTMTNLPWFTYPIVVPFGDTNYDSALGGSHDLTIAAPANWPVTALLDGTVSSITTPAWGKQVGILLDKPYNSIPYCSYLHLSAVKPSLKLGSPVRFGDIVGWVGGATDPAQYVGTSNPTGANFLDNTFNSSRIQVGFALMRGSAYGSVGWENFPPIDWSLDPTQIITDARNGLLARVETLNNITKAAYDTWNSTAFLFGGTPPPLTRGIAQSWLAHYLAGSNMPPPITQEFQSNDWSGNPITVQLFAGLRCEWNNGTAAWYKMSGGLF